MHTHKMAMGVFIHCGTVVGKKEGMLMNVYIRKKFICILYAFCICVVIQVCT